MTDQDLTQPIQLDSLIDYQDNSIVSRELLRKETGTVTLFAFDKGQGLSEHTAPFDAIVLVVDGEGDITISGNSHHVSSGDIILTPAGEPHAVTAIERFKMMLIMLKKLA